MRITNRDLLLYIKLKAYRLQKAKKHKIAAYCIFNNRTLEEINVMVSEINPDIIKTLKYTTTISTTDIIQRIKERDDI